MTNNIPKNIVDAARTIYKDQSFGPVSPVQVDSEGRVCFCAAAALLLAGYRVLFGRESELDFRRRVLSMSKVDMIADFERLGWDGKSCREIFMTNDAYPDGGRKWLVLERLLVA